MTKKILKYIGLGFLVLSLIFAIITLVNYYSYVNCLTELKNAELNLIEKFELQEAREDYLFKTLKTLLWTCYITIISVVINITNFVLSKKKSEPKKIR